MIGGLAGVGQTVVILLPEVARHTGPPHPGWYDEPLIPLLEHDAQALLQNSGQTNCAVDRTKRPAGWRDVWCSEFRVIEHVEGFKSVLHFAASRRNRSPSESMHSER